MENCYVFTEKKHIYATKESLHLTAIKIKGYFKSATQILGKIMISNLFLAHLQVTDIELYRK